MNWESLIACNVTVMRAIASPGSALLHFTRTTVASRRMAGLLIGIGVALVAACWTLAALLGLEILFFAAFVFLLGAQGARSEYLRLRPLFDRVAGTLLGAPGLRLLLER